MKDTKEITISILTQSITSILDISERALAAMINISPVALSNNKKNRVDDVITQKIGRRIVSLYLVIQDYFKEGYEEDLLIEVLRRQVFADLQGNFDSVLSSIQQDKYQPAVLVQIAKLAYDVIKSESNLNKIDEFYPAVKKLAEAI